jgi:hypothetical protein
LLGRRDVAIVEFRHRAFLLPDRMILAVRLAGFCFLNLAFADLLVDAPVLTLQAVIDLVAAGVVAFPMGFRHRSGGCGSDHRDCKCENGSFRRGTHGHSFHGSTETATKLAGPGLMQLGRCIYARFSNASFPELAAFGTKRGRLSRFAAGRVSRMQHPEE